MNCTKEARLSYTRQAKDILARMTLEEKVYLMSGRASLEENVEAFTNPTADNHYNVYPYPAGGNARLQVPELLFCDGPRGVVVENSTCFPVTMARGATFDPGLEREVGEAIACEIRAYGGNFFGGVCINLPYNPGWGRSQEVYGEDGFHLGTMGRALVEGIQKHNVIACIKHFAFNSMENGRFTVSVQAGKRTEREVYLRHFERCIRAGAAAVMSAYNNYQHVPCGQQKYLLTDVLKGEWDFDGFVVSDFMWGTKDTERAANAGLDVEMCDTHFYGEPLAAAVREGRVPEAMVDDAALRIIRTLLAFTQAKDPQVYPRKTVACLDHIALARRVAEKSMTLVQNNGGVLPFGKAAKRVAVLGALGNVENIGDHGSSRVFPPYVVTPVAGITRLLPDAEVVYYGGEDLARAKQAAAEADAVVIVAGYNHGDEGEYLAPTEGFRAQGGDRVSSLGLSVHEIELIRTAGPANPNTAVVLIGGNMIVIDEWKDAVPAILMAYYPGMEGGTVIAETLFGDVNPGGKLPFVIVKQESDLPQVDWDAAEITYDYYHGYARLDRLGIQPSVPYGFGLSYTSFALSNVAFRVENDEVVAECTVANTGARAGDEVVQLYIGFSNSKIDRPVKTLRGYQRVTLQAGQSTRVAINCPVHELTWFGENGWELEHMEYDAYLGTSSADADLARGSFVL